MEHLCSRRATLASAGVLLSGSLAGCLGGGSSEHELGEPEPYVEVRATGTDVRRLDPPVVHVVTGGMIEWVAESGTHEMAAYHPTTHGEQRRIPDGGDPWSSEPLSDAATFDREFDEEGVYDYACTVHEDCGMVGSVVVGWPRPANEPGLHPPTEALPADARATVERHNDRVRTELEAAHE